MKDLCPKCNGSGAIPCTECNGQGWLWDFNIQEEMEEKITCYVCNGTLYEECENCDGKGEVDV